MQDFVGHGTRQEFGKRAHIFGDGHLVVVQDDHQIFIQMASLIQSFVGETTGHRAVTDHGNDLVVRLLQVPGHVKAERRRN